MNKQEKDAKKVQRFRDLADNLQETIDSKRLTTNPCTEGAGILAPSME